MIKNFKKICDKKGTSKEANSHFLATAMVYKCPFYIFKKCVQNLKIALFQTFKKDTYRPPPWLKNAPLRCPSVLYTQLKGQGSGMSSYWDITENNCTPCRHFYLLIVGNREIDPYMEDFAITQHFFWITSLFTWYVLGHCSSTSLLILKPFWN